MKSWTDFIVLFLLDIFIALTTALSIRQHLVTFEPEIPFVPQETVVAAQLHVTPRADGTGDYLLKEVPLISRNLNKEILSTEEKRAETSQMSQMAESVTVVTTPEVAEAAESAEVPKTINDGDELMKKIEDIDENSKSVDNVALKPQKHKYSTIENGHPVYIKIPIYVNSAPELPLMLSVASQPVELTSNRKSIAGRRGSLQSEHSPTSLYNKLLQRTIKENK